MDEAAIQETLDRQAIIDTINSYAYGVDFRDWDLFRSIFTDEVEVHMSHSGEGPKVWRAEDWAARVRDGLSGYRGTQHLMANYDINLNGDAADTMVYFQAVHYLPNDLGGSLRTIAGHYNHDLARTETGWKIRKYKLTVTWNEGNMALGPLAAQLWQKAQGRS